LRFTPPNCRGLLRKVDLACSKSSTLTVCLDRLQWIRADRLLGTAFLAQSPQLAKQMCIAGDMEKVYEIGPGMLFGLHHPLLAIIAYTVFPRILA
jgi:hypothetical protein